MTSGRSGFRSIAVVPHVASVRFFWDQEHLIFDFRGTDPRRLITTGEEQSFCTREGVIRIQVPWVPASISHDELGEEV
eukprot:s977_g12.t1